MAELKEVAASTSGTSMKVIRCMDWLQKQNSQVKKSLQNKNDIQFIIQMNADRKNFLLAAAEDEASVPPGVGENNDEPKAVPLRRLRVERLSMECEWHSCRIVYADYDQFQKHIKEHALDLHAIKSEEGTLNYVCLWDVCGHKTSDLNEMTRHMNYHAYHTKLLAIGFNGRATLKLLRCRKDSTRRNMLPPLKNDHCCMWTGCSQRFNSIQDFFNHVKHHINYSDKNICSWAGCGATFQRKVLLTMHVRAHTGERLIACFHCGQHFATNTKLMDHLRRQNVNPNSPYTCKMCGMKCATSYLLGEHQKAHVSSYACALCDMSAQTKAALALHVRYRHLAAEVTRTHACPQCQYKAITKWDLEKHIKTHKRKPKKQRLSNSDLDDISSESEQEVKMKVPKKYACHLCPKKEMKVYARGTALTTHLIKVHGAQWTFGYSRFRYQLSEDGFYRLTTTRYEYLEVSEKIVDGGPQRSLSSSNFDYTVKKISDATETTPTTFEVFITGDEKMKSEIPPTEQHNNVEITMCDVDEKGNIIKSEILNYA